MNVLSEDKRIAIELLLKNAVPQREISRKLKVHRDTIRSIAKRLASDAPKPEDGEQDLALNGTSSACEPWRAIIEGLLAAGRNGKGIYQELVDDHSFPHAYNSVKRFVATLKHEDPEIYDVLDHLKPGEECQVDYGLGAPTRHPKTGKYKRPYLFVMVSPVSGKAFRHVVWKTNQVTWAKLHEMAFKTFGGAWQYVVLDNLKEGVIKPNIYEPQYNPIYVAVLKHHGVVPDAAKVRSPDRKGAVESGVKHTQATALKGKKFESIEEQNAYLQHWEDKWASTRIHGRKKQQVLKLFEQEKPFLIPLPPEPFRFFEEETRTVAGDGFIEVKSNFYSALPSRIYSKVRIRIYDRYFEILREDGGFLRRWDLSDKRGTFQYDDSDRIFNPSRKTSDLLRKAEVVGPNTAKLAQSLFDTKGRPATRVLYGLANIAATEDHAEIESVIAAGITSIPFIKDELKRRKNNPSTSVTLPKPSDEDLKAINDYEIFFNHHANNK